MHEVDHVAAPFFPAIILIKGELREDLKRKIVDLEQIPRSSVQTIIYTSPNYSDLSPHWFFFHTSIKLSPSDGRKFVRMLKISPRMNPATNWKRPASLSTVKPTVYLLTKKQVPAPKPTPSSWTEICSCLHRKAKCLQEENLSYSATTSRGMFGGVKVRRASCQAWWW